MQIRSILVHLDPGLASVTRLTLAHGLAERLDAELTLLFGSAGEAASPAFAYSASVALHAAQESEAMALHGRGCRPCMARAPAPGATRAVISPRR